MNLSRLLTSRLHKTPGDAYDQNIDQEFVMHSTLSPSRPSTRRPLIAVAAAVAACLAAGAANAQIVPRATHVLRSVGGSEYSFTRLNLRASGLGLNLAGQTFWPSWEGRVGVMMDRPTNPLKDTYVLFQPVSNGLNIRACTC